MSFSVGFDSSVNSAPASFVSAVDYVVTYFNSLFTNSVAITIDVGYGEIDGESLGSNALGESLPAVNGVGGDAYIVPYSQVVSALQGENAPGSSSLPASSPDQGSVVVTAAEGAALGLTSAAGVDGYVGFSAVPNIFSYANGVAPPSSEYYFIGVVEHEFTEVMGRISLLDDQPDYYTPIDLFRYSAPGVRDLSTGSFGSSAYFSINNGVTNLGNWNNNIDNGDLGDWYPSGPAPGGNDAFNDYSNPGVIDQVSANDLTLMNALGWTTSGIEITATASDALQGGPAVALLAVAPTITDNTETDPITESASIKITNGSGSAVAGDELYVNGQQSGTIAVGAVTVPGGTIPATTITVNWNASTDTLTLSGITAISTYETLLNDVTYQDTGIDSSTIGHPQRTVSWSVNDGSANYSTTSQITIDRAPTANNDTASDAAGATLTTTAATGVLANDTDLDRDTLTVIGVSDTAHGAGTIGQSLAGVYGHLTLNANGSYSYAADINSAIYGAPTGSRSVDSFTYTESDGNGGTSTATLSVTVDRPPVMTVSDVTASSTGQVLAASSLFSVSDLDGNPITEYYFFDKTVGNGYWALNGVAEPSNQTLAVTAAQLSQVTFQSGTSGSDNVMVAAADAYSSSPWTSFQINAAVVYPPVLTVSTVTASSMGEVFAASSLFSVSDPGGNPITEYYFYDKTVGNGYWALNGVAEPSNQTLAVTAAQLSQVTFQSGATGSDNVMVAAADAYSSSPWTSFQIKAAVVTPPVVTASNATASTPGQVFAAASFFSVGDPGGNPITEYYFYDKTVGNGYWALNGVAEPSDQTLAVAAAQLSQVTFQSGTSGSDDVMVAAADAYSSSPWTSFQINAAVVAPPAPPVVTASNATASSAGQVFTASSLFSVNDPGGNPITEYYFYDKTVGNGYWALNGVAEPSDQTLAVAAAQLSQVTFQSGTSGSDDVMVAAADAYSSSPWTSFQINAAVVSPPVVTASDVTASSTGQVFAASSLFSVSDPGGNPITQYYFYDKTAGSGYWALNGVAAPADQDLVVSAAQLSQVTFQSATSGSDDVMIAAADAYSSSPWTEFQINAAASGSGSGAVVTAATPPALPPPAVPAPQVTASDVFAIDQGQAVTASSLFSASDPNGNPITEYDFKDAGVGGAGFSINGVAQGSNQDILVSAAQLSQTTYQSGSGTDTISIRASDGTQWSSWTNVMVNAMASTFVASNAGSGSLTVDASTSPSNQQDVLAPPNHA